MMQTATPALVLVLLAVGSVTSTDADTLCAPQHLQVEYRTNPLGIDTLNPRFSFQLCSEQRDVVQTQYEIQVAHVVQGQPPVTVWASGPVASNSSTNIAYPASSDGATPLVADADYQWTVMVTGTVAGGAAVTSAAAEPATFSTGLFNYPGDWDGAEWIGAPAPQPAHTLLRTTFEVPADKQVTRAVAYTVGLGYYKLHVDGTQVSTHELGAFTTYEKRVLYDTYDCLDAILTSRQGSNHTLAVELGPGWYAERSVHVGEPSLLIRLSLQFSDKTTLNVVSKPGSWQVGGVVGW